MFSPPYCIDHPADEEILREALEQYVDNMRETLAEFGGDRQRMRFRRASIMLEELETRVVKRAEGGDGKEAEPS